MYAQTKLVGGMFCIIIARWHTFMAYHLHNWLHKRGFPSSRRSIPMIGYIELYLILVSSSSSLLWFLFFFFLFCDHYLSLILHVGHLFDIYNIFSNSSCCWVFWHLHVINLQLVFDSYSSAMNIFVRHSNSKRACTHSSV